MSLFLTLIQDTAAAGVAEAVEQINGDTPKWNAVCIHLKSQYSKPQYQFIIDAFDSLGMKIYS